MEEHVLLDLAPPATQIQYTLFTATNQRSVFIMDPQIGCKARYVTRLEQEQQEKPASPSRGVVGVVGAEARARVYERPVVHVSAVEPRRLESYASTPDWISRIKRARGANGGKGDTRSMEVWNEDLDLAAVQGDRGRVSLVGREHDVGVRVDGLLAAVHRGWGSFGGAHGGSPRGRAGPNGAAAGRKRRTGRRPGRAGRAASQRLDGGGGGTSSWDPRSLLLSVTPFLAGFAPPHNAASTMRAQLRH